MTNRAAKDGVQPALFLVLLAVASLLGCGATEQEGEGETGEGQRVNVVDCLGMVPEQISGAPEGTTRLPVGGALETFDTSNPLAAEVGEGDRCWFRFTGPVEGTVDRIGFDVVNSALLVVNLGGRAYVMQSGSFTFDEGSSRGRASGIYEGDFYPASGDGGSGVIELQGRFDYCHMPSIEDCPYRIEGMFDYPLTISAPKLGSNLSAEATECRMLIDRSTGAAQLDVEIGVWRGVNLGQLFESCADIFDVPVSLINYNRLTFRTGGVTGPGTFGPYVSRSWAEDASEPLVLPELYWEVPPTFIYLYTGYAAATGICTTIRLNACPDPPCGTNFVRTTEGSICTLTVTEPDQVSLVCQEVQAQIANLAPQFERGDFELNATCRIEYVE